jgi:hypothetical protein
MWHSGFGVAGVFTSFGAGWRCSRTALVGTGMPGCADSDQFTALEWRLWAFGVFQNKGAHCHERSKIR